MSKRSASGVADNQRATKRSASIVMGVQVGERAPEFALPDQNATPRGLRQFAGKRIVLYFYPKANTSGCTQQAEELRDALPLFESLDAQVIGISPDSTKSIKAFASKFKLTFPLLGDEPVGDDAPTTIARYGCWGQKQLYGRKYMGVLRNTFIIDGAGMVTHRFDKVDVEKHRDLVLGALRGVTSELVAVKARRAPVKPAKAVAKVIKKVAKVTKKTAKVKKKVAKAPPKAGSAKRSPASKRPR